MSESPDNHSNGKRLPENAAEYVEWVMDQANVKIGKLAKIVEIDVATLSRIKNGHQQPSPATLKKISDKTGIPLPPFVTGAALSVSFASWRELRRIRELLENVVDAGLIQSGLMPPEEAKLWADVWRAERRAKRDAGDGIDGVEQADQ